MPFLPSFPPPPIPPTTRLSSQPTADRVRGSIERRLDEREKSRGGVRGLAVGSEMATRPATLISLSDCHAINSHEAAGRNIAIDE